MEPCSLDHRRKQFKAGLSQDQARKNRANATAMIRKQKRAADFAKRRAQSGSKALEALATVTHTSDLDSLVQRPLPAKESPAALAPTGNASKVTASKAMVMTPAAFASNAPTIAQMLHEAATAMDAKETPETQRDVLKALILIRRGVSTDDENIHHPVLGLGPSFLDLIYKCAASSHLRISYEALWILTNLSSTSATKHIASKEGFVPFLIQDRLVHPDSPAIRSMAIWLLANIAADGETRHLITAAPSALDPAAPPAWDDPRQWSSVDLGPRLLPVVKDLLDRHDSDRDESLDGDELANVAWFLTTLADPLGRREEPSQPHFEWFMSQMFPIVEMVMFSPSPDGSSTLTLRQGLSPSTYADLLKVIYLMTTQEEDRAMAILVKRPIWMVTAIQWIQQCMATGTFDLMDKAIMITGNLVNGSSAMATPMVKAGVIQLYYIILDHPSCTPVCKKEAAYNLSNIALDDIHHVNLYTADYIGRAVSHWAKGTTDVRREFTWFFYHLLESHTASPGPIFELLAPTPFYETLKQPLQKMVNQTVVSTCMKICKILFELGYGEELREHGIDEVICDELSTFPFAKGEDSELVSELVAYCEAEED